MNENQLIQNNLFGLNLTVPKKSIDEISQVVRKEIEDITANPFVDYLNDNDKVFSGEVAEEIRKYQARIYSLGQVMREGQEGTHFNVRV